MPSKTIDCIKTKMIYKLQYQEEIVQVCHLKVNADCTGARVMLPNNLGEHCSVAR